MREQPQEKPKKRKLKIAPIPLVKTIEKVHAGISHLNRSLMPASSTVLEMIVGGWLSQAIYVAAELEIADHLKFGPKSTEELADRTNTHEGSLYRLLRMLAGHGLFQENKEGLFSQTPLSDSLRSDHPSTVRGMAIYQGGFHWKHWEKLLYSVRTGKPSVDDIEEASFFDLLNKKPELGIIFDQAMSELSALSQDSIVKAFDFSRFRKIVDVGGGEGRLLEAILEANSRLKGILFERRQILSRLTPPPGLQKRLEHISGSFLSEIPVGGDCYMLKQVIHDWDDSKAIKILENVCHATPSNGKLLLIEAVVPEGNSNHLSKDTDLEMLVSVGGKERTRDEYSGLLAEAGFRLENLMVTATPLSILVAAKI